MGRKTLEDEEETNLEKSKKDKDLNRIFIKIDPSD